MLNFELVNGNWFRRLGCLTYLGIEPRANIEFKTKKWGLGKAKLDW